MFGRKVKIVVKEYQSKGDHSVDITTENLPNGLYAYQLRVGNNLFTKKMVVIK